MEEINLLQNRIKDTTFAWEKQGRVVLGFLWLILIAILGVSALLYVYNGKIQTDLDSANQKVETLQKQLNQKQASLGDAKTFQAQLANIRTLLGSHIYISPVLDEISSSAFNKSQFSTIDLNQQTGKVHLEGMVGSYIDLGKLLLSLTTSDKFNSVKLLSVLPSNGQASGYHFSIDLLVAPELFTKQ